MEASEIDEAIERYRAAESRIAANLVELDDHPTFGLVTSGVLTGASRTRAEPIAATAPVLWAGLDALRTTLDRATELRGTGRIGAADRAALAELLSGPSVLVEVTATPLGQRDLLAPDSIERRVSIDALIDELRGLYEPLRDLVAAIDAVWRDLLPRLDAAESTISSLEGELGRLGTVEPAVGRARARLAELRRQVMDDPLGVGSDASSSLQAELADAVRRVGDLQAGHDSLHHDLARTEALVVEARTLRAGAAAMHSEVVAKIANPSGLVMVPAQRVIDSLAAEAADLRAAAASDQWHHVRVRLDPWLERSQRLVEQLRAAEMRNRAPLERRDELRGLLVAFRAKAAARGRIEAPELTDLADEAHNELYTSPVDLVRAEHLVTALGAAIADAPGGTDDKEAR